MADLCPICYTNSIGLKVKLSCGFQVCPTCFVDWVEARIIKVKLYTTRANKTRDIKKDLFWDKIPCVNHACSKDNEIIENKDHHELTHSECLKYLQELNNKTELDRFTRIMLDTIAVQENDYRKCPSKGCDYIGTINMRPSNAQLQCEKCNYEWDDPSMYPFFKRMQKTIGKFFSMNSDHLNSFQKVMNGEPCPNCGICIIKLNGCDHMVWAKCEHEFCWLCLGKYPSYQHTEQTFCPLRKVMIWVFVFFLMVLSIDVKLCLRFEIINYYERILLSWLSFFVLTNVYAGILFLEIFIISEARENRQLMISFPDYASFYQKEYIQCVVFAVIYPFIWLGGSICAYLTLDYFRQMLNLLGLEAMIIFILVVTFMIIMVALKIWGWRQEEYQENPDMISYSSVEGNLIFAIGVIII